MVDREAALSHEFPEIAVADVLEFHRQADELVGRSITRRTLMS
jgi:hypothetical protein